MAFYRVRNKLSQVLTLRAQSGDTLDVQPFATVIVTGEFIEWQMPSTAEAEVTNLDGGPVPDPTPPAEFPNYNATTRKYSWDIAARLAVNGTSARTSAGISAKEILLASNITMFVKVGDDTVVAADAAGSIPLIPGEKFHLQITPGQYIAAIRDGVTDGTLYILPVVQP